MSSLVETAFYTKEKPWHNIGTVVSQAPSIAEAINLAGLNWNVIQEPIYRLIDGNPTEVEGFKALVRNSDRTTLGVASSRYNPLQNTEAFKFFDFLLAEGDASLEAAGSLRNGKQIWILAKINIDEQEVIEGDLIRPYILLSNAHTGKQGIWLQFTPVRVVCANTLAISLKSRHEDRDNGTAMRINHSSSMNSQIQKAKDRLDLSKRQFNSSMDDFRCMAKKAMTRSQFEDYIKFVFEKDELDTLRAYPKLEELFTQGTGNQGKTAWDALNSVTEFTDHIRGRDGSSRLYSTWFGNSRSMRDRAHEAALSFSN